MERGRVEVALDGRAAQALLRLAERQAPVHAERVGARPWQELEPRRGALAVEDQRGPLQDDPLRHAAIVREAFMCVVVAPLVDAGRHGRDPAV